MSVGQLEHESKHKVRIHIDEKPYESPNPTTGESLYTLGHVPAGLELYREVRGDHEDPPIPNGPQTVRLEEDEHFHSGSPRLITIYVNTDEHQVEPGELTFQEVVKLAYPDIAGDPNILFKVSYRLGRGHSELKTLAEGGEVEAREGMIFNVTYETRS